jgi:TonB-linked SusC/RagA family outer membrane protein
MQDKMKLKIKRNEWIMMLLSFIVCHTAAAQVEGTVSDASDGTPLPGATVLLKGTPTHVITDARGYYQIEASTKDTLVFSFIGLQTEETPVGERREIHVSLKENRQLLNEVVVVGYGTQRRKELTGAVATVSAEVLRQPVISLDALLGGAVAGLNVTQTSGAPGAPSNIRIRGGNSINAGNEPLYVIDGFIFYADPANSKTGVGNIEGGLNPLASVNPADIESVEILKDVSATAIYGSRGANGVIMITTKKGQRGRNSINYRYTASVEQLARKLSLINAAEWANLQNAYDYNYFSPETIAALGEGSDWQNAIFRTAHTQNHSVSFNGGDNKTQYLISGDYTSQQGIVTNTGFERFAGRINLAREIFEGLIVNVAATGSKSTQHGLTTDADNPTYKGSVSNPLRYALRMSPAVAIYNADGTYNHHNPYEKSNDLTRNGINPNPIADMNNNTAESVNSSLLGSAFVQYSIMNGLTLKANFGINTSNTTQNFFAPQNSLIGLIPEGKGGTGNKRYEASQQEYTVNFTRHLGRIHLLNVLAGYTTQSTRERHSAIVTAKFSKEDLGADNLYDGNEPGFPVTGGVNSTLNSVLARVNYTLLSRYNLTATFRADESSRFAPGHRWGYFPSLGLSWNILDENSRVFLQTLKLRLSAGSVGNQEIADGLYAANYTADKSSQDGEPVTVYTRARLGNPDLKWETTTQYNAGLDAALWNSRITLTADAYYKKTADLLYNAPLDAGTGFRYQMQNIGSVENKGVELSVGASVIETEDWNLSLSANIAHNKNRITDLGAVSIIKPGGSIGNVGGSEMILQTGESLGTFYGLVFDGVVQPDEDVSKLPVVSWMGRSPQPGDPKFRDVKKDNRIDADDRTVLGSIQPDFTYGFIVSAKWRNFDWFASLQGSVGGKVYNQLRRELETPDGTHNFSRELLNAYTNEKPSATVPRISREIIHAYLDSRYVENASYLRVRDISLGYTLPLNIRENAYFKAPGVKLRLFVSVQNLFTVTAYRGYDPEVGDGVDLGMYPKSRIITAGGSITF